MLLAVSAGALVLAAVASVLIWLQTRRLAERQRGQEKLERSSLVIEE
jgi:hypothetical protein